MYIIIYTYIIIIMIIYIYIYIYIFLGGWWSGNMHPKTAQLPRDSSAILQELVFVFPWLLVFSVSTGDPRKPGISVSKNQRLKAKSPVY